MLLPRRHPPLPAIAILALIQASSTPALNLERLSATRLSVTFELLDVEHHEGVLAIPGGLGGTAVIDVTDPRQPVELSRYSDTLCLYGRLYNTFIGPELTLGAGRNCPLVLLEPGPGYHLDVVGRHQTGDASYEDAAVRDDLAAIAAHDGGLELIDISDPGATFTVATVPLTNAWAVRIDGDHAYVADGGGGLAVVDISDPYQAFLAGRLVTSGAAKDVRVRNGLAFLALGDAGVAMIDVSTPSQPVLAAEYNTTGNASHLGASDSLVAVADWDDVEILRYDHQGMLELTGSKKTGGRVMGVEIVNDVVYVAEWSELHIYSYGPIAGPDLDLDLVDINFPKTEVGASRDTTIQLSNSGGSTLTIESIDIPHADLALDPAGPFSIMAGGSRDLTITYTASEDEIDIRWFTIHSNDTDDSAFQFSVQGNSRDLNVGDPAPDFTIPVLDGAPVTLSELRGSVVVLTFFASW